MTLKIIVDFFMRSTYDCNNDELLSNISTIIILKRRHVKYEDSTLHLLIYGDYVLR